MRRAQLRFKSLSSWIKNVWFILIKPGRRYFFQEGRSAAWLLLLRTCKQRTCGADQNHNNIINITADFKALQNEIQTKSKALLQKKQKIGTFWLRKSSSVSGWFSTWEDLEERFSKCQFSTRRELSKEIRKSSFYKNAPSLTFAHGYE